MNTLFERIPWRSGVLLFIVLLVLLIIVPLFGQFFYFLETVEEQEIGIRFRAGQVEHVVGPGVYSAFGLFVDIQRVSVQAIPFTVRDEEIITADKQRIGLVVSGDIFRPRDLEVIRGLWSQYRGIYLDDELAASRIQDLARQSMKVCVGDRSFDDNIIGTSRDALRACIDTELNDLADEFGISIRNLVVPEVVLSPEVQTALDAIVQSRLETEKAAQDELRERAQAQAEQARQEGEIRVEQSRIQEQTRQQTELAQLERQRLDAQLEVIESERANSLARIETQRQEIEANKTNELLAAERDVDINAVLAEAAAEKAKADLASQFALAELYASNPEYLQLNILQTNASALNPADKIIFTPEGTTPTLVLPGPGIVPTVDTSPQASTSGSLQSNSNSAPAVQPEPEPATSDDDG